METINKYKATDRGSEFDVTLTDAIHSSSKDGAEYGYIDFDSATKEELQAFRQGWVDRMISEKNFDRVDNRDVKQEGYNEMPTQYYPNTVTSYGNIQNDYDGQGNQRDKQKVKLPAGVQQGRFSASDINYPNNMAAFADKLLIALLSGFGIGVVCTAVYIFTNLSKVTVSLN